MNLNLMTVSELRKLAAQFSIAGRSTMKKAELIRELSDPDIADLVALSITVDEIDEDESIEDTMQALANAEADAECERARRLAEYDADEEAGELLDAALGEYVEPTADTGKIAITKYSGREAIATAVFGTDSIAGYVTKQDGRWVLRDGVRKIRAKTLGKVAKQWAKALNFHATTIDVETMR